MEISEHIIKQAREWIGTRFLHQGRRKINSDNSGGVDCLGLLLGVASELQLVDRSGTPFSLDEEMSYSKIPNGYHLEYGLKLRLHEVNSELIETGDVMLFEIDGNPQHLAIISDYGIIHAYAPSRKVVEHRLDDAWCKRMVSVFRLYAPSKS